MVIEKVMTKITNAQVTTNTMQTTNAQETISMKQN